MRKYPITLRVKEYVTLGEVIKAVEDLLFYYQHSHAHRFDGIACPFCDLFFGCKECLWGVFHHMECDDFAEKRFGDDVGSLKRDKKWRAFRVKELTYWLQELQCRDVKIVAL